MVLYYFRDPPHTLESTDNILYIRYYTNSNSPNNGFKEGSFVYFWMKCFSLFESLSLTNCNHLFRIYSMKYGLLRQIVAFKKKLQVKL